MANKLYPIPEWMHVDTRPLDKGEWQQYGYGYTREVHPKYERWRPATRYIRRSKSGKLNTFEVVTLMPGAYYVSDHGRIWSAITNKIIIYRKHKRARTNLMAADGTVIAIRTYKLALDNFIEPPATIRHAVYYLLGVVNHKDNRPWHNWLDNLQYSNQASNVEHGRQFHKQAKGG